MSYCVNCGVELGKEAKVCPLCGTPVINPGSPADQNAKPYYPTRKEEIPAVSKRSTAAIISAMLASVAICCGLLNLVLRPDYPWSLYAAGAALMFWIFFVPPLLWRKIHYLLRTFINMCAMAVYVWLIAVASGGMVWFQELALPILVAAAAIGLCICWVFRNHSRLSTLICAMVGLGLFCEAIEFFVDRFLRDAWEPVWSLVVATVALGLAVPFIVIRMIPALREEARRIFHL